MKKRTAAVMLMAFAIASVAFGVSLRTSGEVHSFDSIPMLEAYYDETPVDDDVYWDSCRISLITIGEGAPLYSWFGHTALLVELANGQSYMFDYGTFSFDADHFYRNFIMGRLWFCCNVSYADYEFSYLATTGRKVSSVELDLTPSQKKAIVSFLSRNSEVQNRTYLYHHYNDNCATRVRDILNYATDGDFEVWAKSQEGLSFRKRASGALSKNRFVQWALEFLQSGQIDGEATAWEEMFLPELLERYVVEYGLETGLVPSDGYELIYEESLAGAGGVGAVPRSNMLFSVAMGLVLALVAFVLAFFAKSKGSRPLGKAYCIYTFVVDLVFGLFGCVLLFMMLFTNHNVTWYNENILFVNPLLMVMAVKGLRLKDLRSDRSTRLSNWYKGLLSAMALLVLLKVVAPGVFVQDNWPVIVTMAPYYVVNAFVLGKRGTKAARNPKG